MSEDSIPDIGPEQLDAALRFLPIFEQPGYVFGEWHGREGHIPYYAINEDVMEFVNVLYVEQIVFSFNWTRWQEEAQKFVDEPEALKTADLLVLRKLLVTHVRTDRFVEGHLASMLESGHITAIVKRLKEIRRQMG